VAFIADTNPS